MFLINSIVPPILLAFIIYNSSLVTHSLELFGREKKYLSFVDRSFSSPEIILFK